MKVTYIKPKKYKNPIAKIVEKVKGNHVGDGARAVPHHQKHQNKG